MPDQAIAPLQELARKLEPVNGGQFSREILSLLPAIASRFEALEVDVNSATDFCKAISEALGYNPETLPSNDIPLQRLLNEVIGQIEQQKAEIADLKRQLAERRGYRDFLEILADFQRMPRKEFDAAHGDDIGPALDAYVQERVDRAVLAESEWWNEDIFNRSDAIVQRRHARLVANRAKVKT